MNVLLLQSLLVHLNNFVLRLAPHHCSSLSLFFFFLTQKHRALSYGRFQAISRLPPPSHRRPSLSISQTAALPLSLALPSSTARPFTKFRRLSALSSLTASHSPSLPHLPPFFSPLSCRSSRGNPYGPSYISRLRPYGSNRHWYVVSSCKMREFPCRRPSVRPLPSAPYLNPPS